MIVKTFLARLSEMLPTNELLHFEDVVHAVESIFNRSTRAELNMMRRRHINLLSKLRQNSVLCIGNEQDEWMVELPQAKPQMMTVAYIEGGVENIPIGPPATVQRPDITSGTKYIETGDGLIYMRMDDTPEAPMSEQGIRVQVDMMQSKPGWEASYMRYEGDGKVHIDGTVDADMLAKLLQLMRAATVPSQG